MACEEEIVSNASHVAQMISLSSINLAILHISESIICIVFIL